MCDPITLTICGVAACCFCCIGIVALATILPMAMQVMGAVIEVMQCTNETIMPEFSEVFKDQDGACAKSQKEECREHENNKQRSPRQMSPEQKKECNKLNQECQCDMVLKLKGMKNPDITTRLNRCCDVLRDDSKEPMVGSYANDAVNTCQDIVFNLTKGMDELAHNCSLGEAPVGDLTDDLNLPEYHDLGDWKLDDWTPETASTQFSQKFGAIGKVFHPGHIFPAAEPAVLGLGMAVLLAGAVTAIRRRTRRPQAAFLDTDAEGAE